MTSGQDQSRSHHEMALVVEHLRQSAYDQELLDLKRDRGDHCSCCGQKLPPAETSQTDTFEVDDGVHVDTIAVLDRRSRL